MTRMSHERLLHCDYDLVSSQPGGPGGAGGFIPSTVHPSPSNKKDQAPSETLGLCLIPGAFSGSLCGAICGSLSLSLSLSLALGLSAEGLISY